MVLDTASIQKKLSERTADLKKFHVSELYIFGSIARKQSLGTSDIDILVVFDKAVSLFQFLDVKYFLESLFGKKIDLVTRSALHPALKTAIEKELVRVA